MNSIGPTDPHEPAVTSEHLLPFVDAARIQRTGPVKVDADALHQLWIRERTRRHRRWLGTATLAAAVVGLLWSASVSQRSTSLPAAADTVAAAPSAHNDVDAPPSITLTSAATITSLDGSAEPAVRSTYALSLPPRGHYRISMRDGERVPLLIDLGQDADAVELHHGVVVILLTGGDPQIRLESGAASLISSDGTTRTLSVTPSEPAPSQDAAETEADAAAAPRAVTAAMLARKADLQLAQGNRRQAIATLTKLVKTHPRASASRAALIDLARLLRASGDKNKARCAYAAFLDRWPHSSLRDEVESAMDKLGPGPSCRGLDPR